MAIRSTLLALSLAATTAAAMAGSLPAPDGRYGVGVVSTEFVDAAHRLDSEDAASGPRRLPALVWYPADKAAGADSPYFSAESAAASLPALARIFHLPEDDAKALAEARVAAARGAPPLRRAGAFPVVVFSHGLLMFPEQNSALATRLASHGYIVVSIAHPFDAADQRLADGRVVGIRSGGKAEDPRFAPAFETLLAGKDLVDRRAALAVYAETVGSTRTGRSVPVWRDDTLAVARAIVDKHEPVAVKEVFAAADRSRLAFAGMSFGGATSATSCRLLPQCRAAVNMDGQNFDPELFDASVGRPLLLLLSDWPRYGLLKGQERDEAFSPNDLAYEPWKSAGTDPAVTRIRLERSRHLGMTDLVALLSGAKHDAYVGEIDGQEALAAENDLVLAFLDLHLRDGSAEEIDRVLQKHPALQRHVPARMKAWSGPDSAPERREGP